jgi:phage tail-like protein
MPLPGASRVWEHKYNFIVEIGGIAHAAYNKCSELEMEIEKVSYREGGRKHPFKAPGLVDFSDITLERGAVADDSDLYDWAEKCASIVADAGTVEPEFRIDFDIVAMDRAGNSIKRWRISKGWVQKFTGGDWDGDSSEVTMEKVVIAFDSFRRVAV